ncbi:MAG: DUF58 domain-containing protein [Gaiella sp.]
MTPARSAVIAGAVLSLTAWSAGSTTLWIAGLGLLLAGSWGLLWAWAVARRARVAREVRDGVLTEGERLHYGVRLLGAGLLPGRFRLVERLGPARDVDVGLRRRRVARAGLDAAPRGRYAIGPGRLVAVDPLGLARVELEVAGEGTVLVLPRVPVIDTLFLDRGRPGAEGRRARARQGGTEPHGVREYQDGEPMRAVHWATSARKGQLMVRELEDAARDEAIVVLDLDARWEAGPPGQSSIDEVVRAAGAVVRAHAARGRRAALLVAGEVPVRIEVASLGRDWDALLVELAAIQATGPSCARARSSTVTSAGCGRRRSRS